MILAIDPGSAKTGIALVNEDGSLGKKDIIPTEALENLAAAWAKTGEARLIVMGNGTHHKELRKRVEEGLKDADLPLPIVFVDEKYTTEMGKERYWKDHPAKGISRLIPKGMRTIPVPVDDYVAWIIGEIYLGTVEAESVRHEKIRN